MTAQVNRSQTTNCSFVFRHNLASTMSCTSFTPPPPIPITNPQDPRISQFMNVRDGHLKRNAVHAAGGLFMAEGELVVKALLGSDYRTHSVLITPNRLESLTPALERCSSTAPVYLAQQAVMDQIAGFPIHRGVLAAGVRPQSMDLQSLLSAVDQLVVLENLANHDNVGGIFRNASALIGNPATSTRKAVGVVLSPGSCDPLYRKALRVSMAHVLNIPFIHIRQSWTQAQKQIAESGFRTIALSTAPDAVLIDEEAVHSPCARAIFIGAEGSGLAQPTTNACQVRVRIPMATGVDSLNAMVATGIALHRLMSPN